MLRLGRLPAARAAARFSFHQCCPTFESSMHTRCVCVCVRERERERESAECEHVLL